LLLAAENNVRNSEASPQEFRDVDLMRFSVVFGLVFCGYRLAQ